ncbi:MAG: O-antigen ligase family protein [Candidatus Sericytochromatia bacterium]
MKYGLNHYIGLIVHYLFFMLFFEIISKIIDNQEKINLLIINTINSAFILSILSINIYILSKLNLDFINYINTNFLKIQFYDRASGISMNPNILAIYLIMNLFLLLGFKEDRQNSLNFDLIYYLKLLISSISLFLTYSRGIITTLIFSLPFLLKKKFIRIIYLIPIFICIDSKWIDRVINSFDLGNRLISTRLFIWEKSLKIIFNNPFGVGILNFEEYYKKYNYENFILIPHAHNWYLQTMTESGIIGTFLIFSIFFYIIYYLFKNLDKKQYYLPLSLVAFSIFNLTDYTFWDIRIKFLLTIIVFIGFYKSNKTMINR